MSKETKNLESLLNNLWQAPEENPSFYLDTGYPPLNKIISGKFGLGIKNGIIAEISGWESSGKTAIATQLMKAAQLQGGVAIFNDFERAFDRKLAKAQGLVDDQTFIYRKPPTGEDAALETREIVKAIRGAGLPKDKPIVVIYDSIPCMTPRALLDKDGLTRSMKDNLEIPMMLSAILPPMIQLADDENVTIIFINQLRDNIGVMYGAKEKTPGGKTKDFAFTIRIKCAREIIKDSKKAEIKLGQLVKAETIKNKQSAPFKKCSWFFKFNEDGTGNFDTVGSTIDFCAENEVGVTKAGSWFEFDGIRAQGKDAFKAAILEANKFEALKSALMALDASNVEVNMNAGESEEANEG